ncbi:hypothetical protein MYP_2796 [Sporocytophaga myxococcoides]|uniref:Uncharacterized protein n=1 Tax=Sporocytophaga myxococcoides TaxID=153721 RepID=A0A098LGK4_9BACT|nr:hypothetical protein [Sporocytophaga myxococcoides]GAL85567.1 hypothetical protein MYP_2796 [Sporocytophaga myxococcoides]
MNFFDKTCQEPPINHVKFGICDDEGGGKAYTDLTDEAKWIATIVNENELSLTFTAIDKCVIKDGEETGRGRCDGMLTSSNHLYLMELKCVKKGGEWKQGAIEQLVSTIQFLYEYHEEEVVKFRHKKAFACNKRVPRFQEIDNEYNKWFWRTYGFRIDVQAEIIVV